MSRTDPITPVLSGPPRIAISATVRADGQRRRVRLNAAYVDAIERAGALPLIVPPLGGIRHATAIIDGCDGLVLTGGEDVDPERYDAARDATVEETNPERDATEIALVQAARARGCPTFAICRGLQLLNVALGGSLIQDIPSRRPANRTRARRRGGSRIEPRTHARLYPNPRQLVPPPGRRSSR